MEPVPQKVLSWLHRVTQPLYRDATRVYNDVAVALGQWPSLRTSSDVFTFEDGQSALLVRLIGTVPVVFRGTTYAIPVTLWIPHNYPHEPPLAFVTPTAAMVVRPGQHVSGEGRVYHPYMAGWKPEMSTLSDLVHVLRDVFSQEPPVVATRPTQQPQPQFQNQQRPSTSAPPVPPLPPELDRSGTARRSNSSASKAPARPPALPPNPYHEARQASPASSNTPITPYRPSLADERAQAERHGLSQSSQPRSASNLNPRYSVPPPLPPQTDQYHAQSSFDPRKVSRPPYSPNPPHGPQQPVPAPQQLPLSGPTPGLGAQQQYPPPSSYPQHYQQQNVSAYTPHGPPGVHGPQQPYTQPAQSAPPAPKPAPPRDLLTDPFDAPLPTHSEPLPAPPIPPNPEKDALLHTLSHTLTTRLHSALQRNDTALPQLRAQHQALNQALSNLQREQQALSTLSTQIASNSDILTQAMRDADACIARAQTASAPGVDEVLVAPTVVGQQLYDLVAEAQALAGARELLGRALDRGRLGAEGWVRSVRGLARDEFLKRVLVEKAARGMGLQGAHAALGRNVEGGWI